MLRFWNNEVLATPAGVLTVIVEDLRRLHPHPIPPPSWAHHGGGPHDPECCGQAPVGRTTTQGNWRWLRSVQAFDAALADKLARRAR